MLPVEVTPDHYSALIDFGLLRPADADDREAAADAAARALEEWRELRFAARVTAMTGGRR